MTDLVEILQALCELLQLLDLSMCRLLDQEVELLAELVLDALLRLQSLLCGLKDLQVVQDRLSLPELIGQAAGLA